VLPHACVAKGGQFNTKVLTVIAEHSRLIQSVTLQIRRRLMLAFIAVYVIHLYDQVNFVK